MPEPAPPSDSLNDNEDDDPSSSYCLYDDEEEDSPSSSYNLYD